LSDLISIIIPTRNRAAVLLQCLEALAQQGDGPPPREVLVIDDYSTDETAEKVRAFTCSSSLPVRYLSQPGPRGANAARNRGLEAIRGEIIIFLDDDVLVPQGWLEKLTDGLRRGGYPVVTGPVRLTVSGNIIGKHREEVGAMLSEVLKPPLGVGGEIVPIACNMAAFRWVFERARFDETLQPPIEEVDWLRRAGVAAGFVPEAWAWHCKTGNELQLGRVLRGAWRRGSEGGWWMRQRLELPWRQRVAQALVCTKTLARALGHAAFRRCWGGVVIGVGEFSKALALVGIINRGDRRAESWR